MSTSFSRFGEVFCSNFIEWSVYSFFPNVLFLLIIWEFSTLHPNHTQFPLLPSIPPTLCLPAKTKQNKYTKSNLCWSMVKVPVASPLKKTEFFPPPHHIPCQKPSTVQSYTSVSLQQFLRTLFSDFLSRLFLFEGAGVTGTFHVSHAQL